MITDRELDILIECHISLGNMYVRKEGRDLTNPSVVNAAIKKLEKAGVKI